MEAAFAAAQAAFDAARAALGAVTAREQQARQVGSAGLWRGAPGAGFGDPGRTAAAQIIPGWRARAIGFRSPMISPKPGPA